MCANPTTEVLVEFDDAGVRLAAKKCVTCPTASGRASVPHPDEKGKCFSCPMTGPPGSETQMTYDASTKTCLCPTGNNAVAGCFDRSINVAKLEAEYDVTIDTAAYTLNYYDMRAALAQPPWSRCITPRTWWMPRPTASTTGTGRGAITWRTCAC